MEVEGEAVVWLSAVNVQVAFMDRAVWRYYLEDLCSMRYQTDRHRLAICEFPIEENVLDVAIRKQSGVQILGVRTTLHSLIPQN